MRQPYIESANDMYAFTIIINYMYYENYNYYIIIIIIVDNGKYTAIIIYNYIYIYVLVVYNLYILQTKGYNVLLTPNHQICVALEVRRRSSDKSV